MCVFVFCARVLCVLMHSCMYAGLLFGSISDTPHPKKQGRTHAFLCVLPSICNTPTRKRARSHASLCVLPIVWSPPREVCILFMAFLCVLPIVFTTFPGKTSVKIILFKIGHHMERNAATGFLDSAIYIYIYIYIYTYMDMHIHAETSFESTSKFSSGPASPTPRQTLNC